LDSKKMMEKTLKIDRGIGKRTLIMGIINVTPDSFSDGGAYMEPASALERAKRMVAEGADMIDVGGESSRPGSVRVPEEEELRRVIPVVRALAECVEVPISVDTSKSGVAEAALSEGAAYINDITSLRGDDRMAGVIAGHGAGVVLMHMKGDPATMQDGPFYEDVMGEILSYLGTSIEKAEEAGINPDKIIVDPGIGFGKELEHNLTVLRELSVLKCLGKPVLVGLSRKSIIGSLTGREVAERVYGSAAGAAAAVMNGADIIRVHDVGAMKDVVSVIDAITSERPK